MKTLVIGVGLVGSQVCRYLVERGERPVVLDRSPQLDCLREIVAPDRLDLRVGDVLNLEALEKVIRDNEIKKVIHTASNPMLTVGAVENPYGAINLNIMGAANVLETARRLDLDRIVYTSSSSLYKFRRGGLESGKLMEDNFSRPTTIYATTKLTCENLGLNYHDIYGVDFVAVRFAAVFGPWSGQGGGGPSMMFKNIIEKSLSAEPANLSPRIIEYVYSKDAARSTLLALASEKLVSRIYNVGMGSIYKPIEIISILSKILPSAKITVEKVDVGNPDVSVEEPMNLERSAKEIGYLPEYDMRDAIADYIHWRTSI